MSEKAVDSLISMLSSLSSKYQSLELRVSVAESLIREHAPKLYKEYQEEICKPQVRGFSLIPTQALQELRKSMLRGPDEESPSSG